MVDDFDVRTLPSNFVSKSQPSKIIEKLNEKRKNEHNAAIEYMNNRKTEVNADIDEEIKIRSRILIEQLNDKKRDVDIFLSDLKIKEEDELFLEENKFEYATIKIIEINEERENLVNELKLSLVNIEKNRLTNFKIILRETYEKMSTIYHKLPFELEEYFENEIININQISLNNFQKQAELQAELKLQIENDTRIWTQELYEIRENIRLVLKEIARKKLLKEKRRLRKELARQRAQMESDFFDYELLEGEDEADQPYDPSAPVVLADVEKWIKDVRSTLAALDLTAKNFVHFYKETIVVLFNRFFEQMEGIKKELIFSGYMSKEGIEEFQSEIYTPAATELQLECQGEFDHLKEVWENTITSMQATLDNTYGSLKTANSLWENHFQRVKLLQNLVVRNVKVTVQKNSLAAEKSEIKANIAIDKLRQAPSDQKLPKAFVEVKKLLDAIEKMYNSNAVSEMNLVKKYRVIMDTEIDVLLSEIQRYLTLNPPDENRDPKIQRKRASQTSELDLTADQKLIPPQMMFCQFQVDAVKDWMFGLWEALNNYTSFGREEILTVADSWIDFECRRVLKRLEMRLSFHIPRYERIKQLLYDKRAEELTAHTVRFNMHKLAADELVKSVKDKQKSNEETYNKICKDFVDTKTKYESLILHSRYSYQIQRHRGFLRNAAKDARDALDAILEENKNICQNILQDLKTGNLKYLSVVRLFSEDGNYAAEEVKVLMKNLTKLEKTTNKGLQAVSKEANTKYNKYNAKIENEEFDIGSMMETISQEHKHNENTVKKIKALQQDIRYEVVALRTDMKSVNAFLKQLVEESMKNLGDQTFLEQFSNNLQEVATNIFDQGKYLAHPEPVVMYTPAKAPADVPTASFGHSSIFSVKPNMDEDTFLSKLMKMLFGSLKKIYDSAKSFYANHSSFYLDSSKIQPSLSDFMGEVLQKYRGFLIQCEICWVENVSEFVNLLNDFIEFKADYLFRFETRMQETSRERCESKTEEVMASLRCERDEIKRRYKEKHEKLKALHGHPKNRELLRALEEEFMELVGEMSEKLGEVLEPYIEMLIEEHENVKTVFEETKQALDVIGQDDGLPGLRNALSDQLTKKLQLMTEMIEAEQVLESQSVSPKSASKASTEFDVPLSVSRQIMDYMKTVEPPTAKSDASLTNTQISLTTTQKSDNFLTELELFHDDSLKNATEFVNTDMVDYHEDFQKIWVTEIERILNLYMVKYDQKCEPQQKKSKK